MLSIVSFFEAFMEEVNKFIEKNYDNPLFWILLFVGLFMLAKFIYESLQKEK